MGVHIWTRFYISMTFTKRIVILACQCSTCITSIHFVFFSEVLKWTSWKLNGLNIYFFQIGCLLHILWDVLVMSVVQYTDFPFRTTHWIGGCIDPKIGKCTGSSWPFNVTNLLWFKKKSEMLFLSCGEFSLLNIHKLGVTARDPSIHIPGGLASHSFPSAAGRSEDILFYRR